MLQGPYEWGVTHNRQLRETFPLIGLPGGATCLRIVHLTLILLLVPAAGLMPPAGGLILVLPVGELPADDAWLRRHGAERVGPGRIANSIVVRGSWARLLVPALGHGAVPLSASLTGCVASGVERT